MIAVPPCAVTSGCFLLYMGHSTEDLQLKNFSYETFFKMFFKQFKSIRIFLFRRYMKNIIVMNFFRCAA